MLEFIQKLKIKKIVWNDYFLLIKLSKFIDLMTSYFCQPKLKKLDTIAELDKIKLEYSNLNSDSLK